MKKKKKDNNCEPISNETIFLFSTQWKNNHWLLKEYGHPDNYTISERKDIFIKTIMHYDEYF